MAFAIQHKSFEHLEAVSTADLHKLSTYCRNWRLKPSPGKTEVSCFHLNSREANHELKIPFEGTILKQNPLPKYLGITLDRTLTFSKHITNTAQKVKTRNNIIQKLAGTSWGASASVLRTSALSLVYSTAEFGAPVWLNSCHTGKLDSQLNTTMRIVSGTIKSTPTEWLPKLTNIAPPPLRRQHSLLREYNKVLLNDQLPLHADVQSPATTRLSSRNSPLLLAKKLSEENFTINDAWNSTWSNSGRSSPIFEDSCREKEFALPRKA